MTIEEMLRRIGETQPMAISGFFPWQQESIVINIMNKTKYIPTRILKSGNRTIVFWRDGTKTIVKRAEDEPESDYNAFTAALGIKCFGSNSALKRIVERTEMQKKGVTNNGKKET